RIRVRPEQLVRGEDHSRRTEAALQSVLRPERVLQRVELSSSRGEALDCRDRSAVGLRGEAGARLHRAAVEQHRARAALARVAADLRAGQADDVAEEMDEKQTRLDDAPQGPPIDGDGDGNLLHGRGLLVERTLNERRILHPVAFATGSAGDGEWGPGDARA